MPSKIIDCHAHAWPSKVSAKAREHLETIFRVKMVGDPTPETLLFYMEQNNISRSAIAAVATRPEQVPSINDWVMGVRSDRLIALASMHPQYPAWKQEVARLRGRVDGFKLQPEFQNFYVDDESVYPLYEAIAAAGLPILFHCGEELSGTMLVRSSPDRLIKVHRQFPKLKIIAGHFGGFGLWPDVEKHLIGEDVYMDTSYFFGFLPDQKVKKLLLAHRADRLLFGTDFPLVDQKKDIDHLRGLGIPEDLKERIFFKNAESLFGA